MRPKMATYEQAVEIFRDRGLTVTTESGGYRQLQLATPYKVTLIGPRMNYTELRKAATLISQAGLY